MIPWRGCASGFSSTSYETVPVPMPPEPAVTVSHEVESLTAVHEQPFGVFSVVPPLFLPAPTRLPGGDSVLLHGAAD